MILSYQWYPKLRHCEWLLNWKASTLGRRKKKLNQVTKDMITDQESMDALKGQITLVVIAHRLATLEGVDRVLVLRDGHLVETGTHQELLEGDTVYSRLFRSQLHF